MAAYHKSNLGSFGGSLVCDLDGYTYTTAAEWLTAANLDGMVQSDLDADADYAQSWAEDKAAEAVEALEESEAAAKEWQDEHA